MRRRVPAARPCCPSAGGASGLPPPEPVHVVLVAPEIPQNTGSIGRLCVATGATLHLIEPLGFQITDRQLRRAGLDYWPHVDLVRHRSWHAFTHARPPGPPLGLSARPSRPSPTPRYRHPHTPSFA